MQARKENKLDVNVSKLNNPDLCGNYANVLVAEVLVRRYVKHRLLRLAACFLLSSAVGLFADGFKFKNGRLADEPAIEIRLTQSQMAILRKHFEPGMKLKLTKRQQTEILAKAKIKVGPTILDIWKPANIEGDCSCFLWNIGLLFKDGWLELPIHRLVSDKQAEANRPDPEG